MDLKTLETLEFPRIREGVCEFCLTQEGRQVLLSALPETEPLRVEALRREVVPFLILLVRFGEDWPESDFPAVKDSLERCAPDGSVLDGRELKAVARYAHSAAVWKRFLAERDEEGLPIWSLRLGDFSVLADALNRVLNADGSINEEAVPSLVRLKADVARSRSEIDQTARAWLKDVQKAEYWQNDRATEKDGRTVLPLKSNFKGRVGAVVHEVSGSGATLFVEPFDLVEKNNRLKEIQEAWRAEINRLLREWTTMVRSVREGLTKLVEVFCVFDGLWARARWGFANRGSFPVLGRVEAGWKLVQARHPLLGTSAVPIDFEVAAGVTTLLISGPNTGGKTATLKTAGLLSLLNQFGLPIPAAPESVLPIWDAVLTDIGDAQSLDQALSTFSGHMTRVAYLLEVATSRSLVLLDELGSGTDPLEGGALAAGFLDHLAESGVTVLATTHHGALKNYAYTRNGFKNASVEFDERSGRPTYHILADVPGSSYALETAERVGIPISVLARARKWIDGGDADVAQVLRTLKEKQLELYEREKEISTREKRFREEKRKTDLLQLRLQQKESELKLQGLGEVNRFVAESRKTFEKLVQEIREGQLTTEEIKKVRGFLNDTEAESREQRRRLDEETAKTALEETKERESSQDVLSENVSNENIRPGDFVVVEPGGQRGVLEHWSGRDRAVVRLGNVKLTVARSSLRGKRKSPHSYQKPAVEYLISEIDGDQSPVFRLDLRGKRLEEALNLVEKQVDRALLKGLHEFSIVHGLGEGILQKGVQDYLRGRPEVQKFFFSHPEEGGFGKTVVQL